jgi:hypothetical protein
MDTTNLTSQLTSEKLKPEMVRHFAHHIAQFEARSGLRPRKVLVNGLYPFDDVPVVEFHVPKSNLADMIEQLVSAEFNPNILINGLTPTEYKMQVMGGP